MKKLVIMAVAALMPATAVMAGQSSSQTAGGTIIWSAPPDSAPSSRKGDEPIIWNDAPSGKPSSMKPSMGAPDKNGIMWNDAPNGGTTTAQAPASTSPAAKGPCRDFQQTIVIDGQRVPAHGTVCQQADGTWRVVDR